MSSIAMSGEIVSIEEYTTRAKCTRSCDIAIIGAGPVGLFAVFQAGLLGLKCILVDALERPGGQCSELYPEKPIYDIPAYPVISGQELTDRLMEQIKPFAPEFLYSQQVAGLSKADDGTFELVTTQGISISAPSVFIAAGAGSFVPRKPKVEGLEAFEEKSFFYAVRNRNSFLNRDVVIFGGGDSALDWTLDLLPQVKSLTLVHRRDKFRAAPATIEAMRKAVDAASAPEQDALIKAHPDLAGKLALSGSLTVSSTKEQAGAGLDQCSPRELKKFQKYNGAYAAKFGFPFIVAVKGLSRKDILKAFKKRLKNSEAEERQTALEQIHKTNSQKSTKRIQII